MDSPVIEMKGIDKIYQTEDIETWALKGIEFTVVSGEYVAIQGASGCGKSTLLSVMGLLCPASCGRYLLGGQDVTELSDRERASVRNRKIGFVFQSFNLIGQMTVLENVALPLSYRSGLDHGTRIEKAKNVLEKVDMSHRLSHFPSQLSGGQQQRVAVARALVGEPEILLADEPTGNLDSQNAEGVLDMLRLLHEEGNTICMVTHDSRSAQCADRVIDIVDGQIHKSI